MSVQQTRAHFLRKYGALVDRPEVGARAYTPCATASHVRPDFKSRVELGVLGNASSHHNLVQQLIKQLTMLETVADGLLSLLGQVGRDLAEVYWRPGNTEPFLGLVERLTGAPLSADAWVAQLQRPLEQRYAGPAHPA